MRDLMKACHSGQGRLETPTSGPADICNLRIPSPVLRELGVARVKGLRED